MAPTIVARSPLDVSNVSASAQAGPSWRRPRSDAGFEYPPVRDTVDRLDGASFGRDEARGRLTGQSPSCGYAVAVQAEQCDCLPIAVGMCSASVWCDGSLVRGRWGRR